VPEFGGAADAGFFARFLAALDAGDERAARAMTAPGAQVTALVSTAGDGACRQDVGDGGRLVAFGRDAAVDGRRHVVTVAGRDGDVELAIGEIRDAADRVVATFIGAGRLDDEGRLVQCLTGRTPAVRLPDVG
jgi:hypothetical protein